MSLTKPAPRKPSPFLIALFVSLSGLFPFAALGQADDVPLEDPEPVIEVQPKQAADLQIKRRLESIYDNADGTGEVIVQVQASVVTLSGSVANEKTKRKAENFAIRTEGVADVENEIELTLDVRDNVTPMIESVQENINTFRRALPLIGFALFIFIVFIWLGGIFARFKKLWFKLAPNPFLAELLSQAARIAMFIAGAVIAMNLLGASRFITTIMGGAGVLGIAIGFAVRDSMENYISSIMLSLRQPFRSQDHVIINEHEGIVVRLTSRATILMTLDGNHLRIPNSVVFKGIILNYTTNPERRFDFELGVDAEDDPIAAMQIGLDAIQKNDFVLDEPPPNAIVQTVGDSNIVIKFTGWVNQSDTDFGKARSIAIRSAMIVLDEKGFTLPEPIYRLRFDAPITDAIQGGMMKNAPAQGAVSASPKPKVERELDPASLDVSPETHLAEKINKEQAEDPENDLLDASRPKE